jgi:hypothetical protein
MTLLPMALRHGGSSGQSKTSSREQGPDFDLVGTLRMVIVRETHGATCMTCWSGSFPVGCTPIRIFVTFLDISGRLLVVVIS